MKKQNDVSVLCLEAFSKISATVTHEIKNTLSIINENAGYMSDLALLAGDDSGVPSQKVVDAAASIEKQVARSNRIVKNLNRFAHSGDTPISKANLSELLQLMIDLTSRQAASAAITVNLRCPGDIFVTTGLLQLETLIFYILQSFYDVAAAGSSLDIDVQLVGDDVEICHRGELQNHGFDSTLSWDKGLKLADYLGGNLSTNDTSVSLTFPCIYSE